MNLNMFKTLFSKQHIVAIILLLYLLPILVLCAALDFGLSSWLGLGGGLLLSAFGTLAFQILLSRWEAPTKQTPPTSYNIPSITQESGTQEVDYTPYIEQIETLQNSVQDYIRKQQISNQEKGSLTDETGKLKQQKEYMQQQIQTIQKEYDIFKNNAHEQMEHHKKVITEQLHTLAEQRDMLEQKQLYIHQLELKTRDLNYELKTLLQLAERPIDPNARPAHGLNTRSRLIAASNDFLTSSVDVQSMEQAHVLLKQCLDIAQNLTGVSHMGGNNPRFRDMALDNFALDWRRLFDRLREINTSIVIVYAPEEMKMLFANEHAKSVTAMNAEKFAQSFHDLISDDIESWKSAINQLTLKNEVSTNFILKSKNGQDISAECLLGKIPLGIFRNYIIGVIYPKSPLVEQTKNQEIESPLASNRFRIF